MPINFSPMPPRPTFPPGSLIGRLMGTRP
jgi:hypothetical protein